MAKVELEKVPKKSAPDRPVARLGQALRPEAAEGCCDWSHTRKRRARQEERPRTPRFPSDARHTPRNDVRGPPVASVVFAPTAFKRVAKRPSPVAKNLITGRAVVAMASAAPEATGEKKKLWGGRFSEDIDPLMEKFNESLSFDCRMAQEDIRGSKGYARALAKTGIITEDERDQLIEGLAKVAAEWADDAFVVKDGDEDIHTANERRLGEIIGTVAGKLHTGRSRTIRSPPTPACGSAPSFSSSAPPLAHRRRRGARREGGGRHARLHPPPSAQTVRWSHWLLSHAAAWQRDDMRIADPMPRVNTLPSVAAPRRQSLRRIARPSP